MTRVIRPTLGFIVDRLLHMLEGDVMNLILPFAFGMNTNTQDFDWFPHHVHGAMWSNYQFIDSENSNENFTHMVLVAPVNVFWVDSGDQVHHSALGIHLVPSTIHVPDWLDESWLWCGISVCVGSQEGQESYCCGLIQTVRSNNPFSASSTTVLMNQPQGTSKTTDKWKIKSSSKSCTYDSHGNPNEVKTVTSNTAATSTGDATTNSPKDPPTINEAWEMVCHLFNKSRILDECQVRVAWAVAAAVSKHCTQLFVPFMSHLSDVTDAVDSWHTKITVIHPEMAHCS